jgi:hypothetical protein
MEKGILRFADIDEGSVHSLHDALNAPQVDRPYMALLVRHFEKDLRQAVIFDYCNTQLVGGCIDNDLFFHGWVVWPMAFYGQSEAGRERQQQQVEYR